MGTGLFDESMTSGLIVLTMRRGYHQAARRKPARLSIGGSEASDWSKDGQASELI